MQLFCIVIAAFTAEITYGQTDVHYATYGICYYNPKAIQSGHRICFSLLASAISSIMVCMVLMILDVFIPCVEKMVKIITYICIASNIAVDTC